MQRSIAPFLNALPGLLLLSYLAAHTAEGWQLLVVGAFLLGFVLSWVKNSRASLVVTYVATASLFAWVLSTNL